MTDVESTPTKREYDPNDTVNSMDASKSEMNGDLDVTAPSPEKSIDNSLMNDSEQETQKDSSIAQNGSQESEEPTEQIKHKTVITINADGSGDTANGVDVVVKESPAVVKEESPTVAKEESPAVNGKADDKVTEDVKPEKSEDAKLEDVQVNLKEEDKAATESSEKRATPDKPADGAGDAPKEAVEVEADTPKEAAVEVEPLEEIDILAETDKMMTWACDEAVKIRMDLGSDRKPETIHTSFKKTVDKYPNVLALVHRKTKEETPRKWTYTEYYRDIRKAAKSFIKLGLEQYHGVGIIGFNSPEWFISHLGAIFAGGLGVGIYTTNSPEACQYVAGHCAANIIVVENNVQLQKILKVRDQLPSIKAIVQYSGDIVERQDDILSWEDFMSKGDDVSDEVLDERIKQQAPNKCCDLIYTSGTTGSPKGVMLSHDNLTWTAGVMVDEVKLNPGHEVVVSYLPLSHIAAQMLDIMMPVVCAATVHFARPDALKGSLVETLKEAKPTLFVGVPRVWEKMQEKMLAVGKNITGVKKKLSTWAKDVGYRGNVSIMKGQSTPFGWTLATSVFLKKAKVALGLDKCRFNITAAAPIMKDTLDYFMSVNIPLYELYGMSECTGPHTSCYPWKARITSTGVEFGPGVKTVIEDPDEDGNGEICMLGRHVFMGYLNMENQTKEALDAEGKLHSGDIGRKDKDGFLYITGRIKEIIITAGGENIAPVPIEDNIKVELPCVSNAMVIGDKRKFLSVILSLKTEVNPDTAEPVDELSKVSLDWCKKIGSSATKVSNVLDNSDQAFLKAVQDGIDRANAKSVSRAQKIAKWSIIPRDFSIPGGELGPTMKLKRSVVAKQYKDTIDAFYKE